LSTILFRNARVFDGLSRELLDGDVLVEDGMFRDVPSGISASRADEVVECGGRTLMPGLIDLHVHIWCATLDSKRLAEYPDQYLGIFAAKALKASLDRGFTTLRDAGGTDPDHMIAIERGLIPSPRFYLSGRFISQTGGHGDFRPHTEHGDIDCPCCPSLGTRFAAIADGPDQVRKAVREQFRRGAKAVKMMCSGGVFSHGASIEALQYSEGEIAAAVDEARLRGSYVFAHAHSDRAIRRCVDLGVRCIEHATLCSAETARMMADRGTYAVPTLAAVSALRDDGAKLGLPEAGQKAVANLYDGMIEAIGHLRQAGVKIGYGTDLAGQFQDRQCLEFGLRAKVMTPYEILISATSVAAEILQEVGRLGVIAPGAHADLIVVDGDPLADPRILAHGGDVIPVIMKAGEFHKREI
jgi:imidazolonepropionase-like amidohydrolase